MRRVQVACSLVVACGLVAARAHSSHVAGTVHVSGLRRVRAGAVERFGRGSLPLLRLRGGEEQKDAKPVQTPAASRLFMMHISPEHIDAALAGFFLAVTIGLLIWADRRVLRDAPDEPSGHLLVLLSSSFLFLAGPTPPPIPDFVLCSGIAFGAITVISSVLLGGNYAGFKLAVASGLLLTLFKISSDISYSNFLVPTLGLALGYSTTPKKLLASPLVALKFLVSPWLLGHGCLYGMALGASNLRRVVRMRLMR